MLVIQHIYDFIKDINESHGSLITVLKGHPESAEGTWLAGHRGCYWVFFLNSKSEFPVTGGASSVQHHHHEGRAG